MIGAILQDVSSGALDALEVPLLQECQQHLFQCLKQTYMGQNGNRADIMLDVGGQLLPAHRLILENRSAFFKAMFQVLKTIKDWMRFRPLLAWQGPHVDAYVNSAGLGETSPNLPQSVCAAHVSAIGPRISSWIMLFATSAEISSTAACCLAPACNQGSVRAAIVKDTTASLQCLLDGRGARAEPARGYWAEHIQLDHFTSHYS